jgi:hypothetical protein
MIVAFLIVLIIALIIGNIMISLIQPAKEENSSANPNAPLNGNEISHRYANQGFGLQSQNQNSERNSYYNNPYSIIDTSGEQPMIPGINSGNNERIQIQGLIISINQKLGLIAHRLARLESMLLKNETETIGEITEMKSEFKTEISEDAKNERKIKTDTETKTKTRTKRKNN